MNIKVSIPIWVDAEELLKRCTQQEIQYSEGSRRSTGWWSIYVTSKEDRQKVKEIIAIMGDEFDEEITATLEIMFGA